MKGWTPEKCLQHLLISSDVAATPPKGPSWTHSLCLQWFLCAGPNPCQNGGTCSWGREAEVQVHLRLSLTSSRESSRNRHGSLPPLPESQSHTGGLWNPFFICWGLGRTGFKSRFPSAAIASAFQTKGHRVCPAPCKGCNKQGYM